MVPHTKAIISTGFEKEMENFTLPTEQYMMDNGQKGKEMAQGF